MTLAEVMVVATLTTILCGAALSLLISLRDWDQRIRATGRQNEDSMRLTEVIRADVRSASEVSSPSPNIILVHFPDDTQVSYELADGVCSRNETAPNAQAGPKDRFEIGSALAWNIAPAPEGRRSAFAISLNRPEESRERHLPRLLIYAIQGADTHAVNESPSPSGRGPG